MIIEGVDPRDIEWEVDRPVYRVYFWHQPPAPPGVPQSSVMYHCDEHRLIDATSVDDVIAWATSTARPDQTFTLYVEHHHDDKPGLIKLAGEDPTESGESVILEVSE